MSEVWAMLLALLTIVLPLLLAWWLVVRGAQRPQRSKHRPGDNDNTRRSLR
ncbi:hypothetical protein LHU53_00615 [Rhodoferax sp. U2-2l]|uniref:hypothetical protein n=1 Tax=Rhodoferax sp. U2-2l TaxID=2884000 RepID=UPI001D0AF250|nr:hypothetical protein [Rhodoferax sp. U2-2l]MCB8745407.1 hypothetical protein [Rhodoferax sp. U2-2l]